MLNFQTRLVSDGDKDYQPVMVVGDGHEDVRAGIEVNTLVGWKSRAVPKLDARQ
jgi:hypothetical protein